MGSAVQICCDAQRRWLFDLNQIQGRRARTIVSAYGPFNLELHAIRDLGKTWVLRHLGWLGEWELAGDTNVRAAVGTRLTRDSA